MIYFLATLIFLFFALSVLCIFGIISGVTGLRELSAQTHPTWGPSLQQLKAEFIFKDRINSLAWSLTVNIVFLLFLSTVAYHMKGLS